jgi:hypothetical protein
MMKLKAPLGEWWSERASMSIQVSWNGTQEESFALIAAISRNCTCEFGLMGVRLSACTSHRMLTEDQRALNGLLFARRMAKRLLVEEFSDSGTISVDP